MSLRAASNSFAYAPVRIGVTVAGSIAGMIGLLLAVRPEAVMGTMHVLMIM